MEDPARIRTEVTTLGDMLLRGWDRHPDRPALVFPEGRLSCDALVQNAMRRARGLWAAGVRPGEHVGILLPTGAAFVETLFAISFIGAVSVLLNARYRPSEIAFVAENADLTTLITTGSSAGHPDFAGRLNEAFPGLKSQKPARAGAHAHLTDLDLPEAPKLRRILLDGDREAAGMIPQSILDRWAEEIPEAAIHAARLRVRVRDTCLILYTSGTSANPKGCLLSHEAVVRETILLGRQRWAYTSADRVWSPLPLYHIAALLGMLTMLEIGGTFIGMPHFDAHLSLKMIEAEGATSLFVPFVTFLVAMMEDPYFDKVDLTKVRHMNSCFAAQPDRIGETWRRKAPHILQCGTYGLTEACGIVSTGGYGMDPELGFRRLGYVLPGVEVRIVGVESGADLPIGEQGEILIRGFSILDGYYRDPVKTTEAIDAQGWFHSGDIGSLDKNGHLMFHGRFKDMLKVGGENVAAVEVEAVLARHPAVKLVQVVGIPDERLVEVPAAFVERAEGVAASEAELIAFTRGKIAPFKVPRHVRFVDSWPMSASKIQKFELRKQLIDELGLDD